MRLAQLLQLGLLMLPVLQVPLGAVPEELLEPPVLAVMYLVPRVPQVEEADWAVVSKAMVPRWIAPKKVKRAFELILVCLEL